MEEEEITNHNADCIHDFNDLLPRDNPVSPVLLGSVHKYKRNLDYF